MKFENEIICGDNMEVMAEMPNDSIDTIITDPPYGLGFMGKDWDTFKDAKQTHGDGHYTTKTSEGRTIRHKKGFSSASAAGLYDHSRNAEFQQWFTLWAKEVLRIAKPGAMMLVFGGTRTFHRLTCAIEDAGWQIRDCMMWLYGSGFPKSHDISKAIDKAKGAEREVVGIRPDAAKLNKPGNHQYNEGWQRPWRENPQAWEDKKNITAPATDLAQLWDGYGTALKPAWEPIIVAMKPLDGTFAHNAEKWGVGGLWIDGGRIGTEIITQHRNSGGRKFVRKYDGHGTNLPVDGIKTQTQGRWPANVILDEEAGVMLDEQSGVSKSNPTRKNKGGVLNTGSSYGQGIRKSDWNGPGDSGGASRFFYCAKASRSERNAGLEGMPLGELPASARSKPAPGRKDALGQPRQNNHPTVKPLKLMEYLCKLTRTPEGGVVLDPFGGSGTLAVACWNTGRKYILIEKDPHYCEIARARVKEARAGQGALFK